MICWRSAAIVTESVTFFLANFSVATAVRREADRTSCVIFSSSRVDGHLLILALSRTHALEYLHAPTRRTLVVGDEGQTGSNDFPQLADQPRQDTHGVPK